MTSYEHPEITRSREERRGVLSRRIGETLTALEKQTAAERLSWYRANRGSFYFEPGERPQRIQAIDLAVPSRREEVTAAAERLLKHEFDILGSGFTALGGRLDWQLDFKSGIRWRNDVIYPAWNWRKVDDLADAEIYRGHFYSIDDPSDLKVPWDLSSFFHMPTLGEAYLETGDPRYYQELAGQLTDWHIANPYPRGVNWTCAMVAGIRMANMMFAVRLIEPDEFLGEFGAVSILRHLKFILDFLEVDRDGRRNNHYVNDLVGLGFGAVEIAGTELGGELLDFAFQELTREVSTQFSEDGTNYEGSIPYQRFAAESIILTAILLERNGRPMPEEARAQLRRILRFIDRYTKPNGLAPQVGDNDNGRILVLHNYARQEYRDHRHILAVGAAWLGLDGFAADLRGQAADVIWLLGNQGPGGGVGPSAVSGLYNRNGYALAKTSDSSLLLRCGPINPMSGGGHNHCDQLSFEFQDRGRDLIVDPGAMIYSADAALRNRARSTAAHNVLQLDELEQQDFNPHDLFSMQDRAAATVDIWEAEGGTVFFRGHHTAYEKQGWRVMREVQCDLRAGRLQVQDAVEQTAASTEGREFCGRLHFAAGIQIEESAPGEFRLRGEGADWTLRFAGTSPEACGFRHEQWLVSPAYGVTLPAAVLEYRFAAVSRAVEFVLEREKEPRIR